MLEEEVEITGCKIKAVAVGAERQDTSTVDHSGMLH